MIDLNLNSAFYGLRAVVGPMQTQRRSSIGLLSSGPAQTGLPGHEAISGSKGGINGLVQAAAASYALRNIRANAVAPGLIGTPFAAPLRGSESARAFSEKMHPLGRIGGPANIASLIAWLLMEDAAGVTGQIWSVDGGLAHLRPRPKAGGRDAKNAAEPNAAVQRQRSSATNFPPVVSRVNVSLGCRPASARTMRKPRPEPAARAAG